MAVKKYTSGDKVDFNKAIKLINLIYKAGYYKKPSPKKQVEVKV